MTNLSSRARRIIAAAGLAGLIAGTAAFAAASPGTALAADNASSARVSSARVSSTGVPGCTAADLGVWVAIDQGNGAAGTIYYPLQFTNLSGHSCSLYGFPGVSAIGSGGNQLGRPAGWEFGTAHHEVVLAAGATAHAILAYHGVAVTTESGCDPVSSAPELRVYPPDQYSATYAAFGFEACSHSGPVYMNVGPILPGVGTIYG